MQGRAALVALSLIACSNHTASPPAAGSGSAAAPGNAAAPGTAPPVVSPPAPPGGSPPGPSTGDPCRFATKEEVSTAAGVTMQRAEQVSSDQCAYYPTASGAANAVYVRVSGSEAYDASKQIMRNTVAVPGIGDDALWAKPQLLVKVGPKMITIAIMDVTWNHGDSQGAAVAVARAAVPRVTAP